MNKEGVINGSKDSQPPRLTPRTGRSAYEPHAVEIGGVYEFALFESSHVEFKPIIGSPPKVSFVYVTLKSVVVYHVNGSRYVPFAASGISDSETPDRPDVEDDPPLDEEFDFELFFLVTTTATGMIIARSKTKMAIPIPNETCQFYDLGISWVQ